MSTEDDVECLLRLRDVLRRAGVEGALHDRLLGAGGAAEGALKRRVGAQAGVDLGEAVRTGEDGDEGVIELLDGCVPDGLLLDLDRLLDGGEELERLELEAEGSERGVGREVLNRVLRAHR